MLPATPRAATLNAQPALKAKSAVRFLRNSPAAANVTEPTMAPTPIAETSRPKSSAPPPRMS